MAQTTGQSSSVNATETSGLNTFRHTFMRFEIGDRVRVAKSMMPEYVGLEGVIVSVRRESDELFTEYTLRTDDGLSIEFLEYQLESATRSGGIGDAGSDRIP